MRILLLSGSSSIPSTNTRLLEHLTKLTSKHDFHLYDLSTLPLFLNAEFLKEVPARVQEFQDEIIKSDAVIISTPEYLHGIPAMLKSAFEWLTASGVWKDQPVIAICYTPTAPRGEKCMVSLLHTLQALDTKVLVSILLHHTDIQFMDDGRVVDNGGIEMLTEALDLLSS